MAVWAPWTVEEPTFIQMNIGDSVIQLSRLNMGDSEVVNRMERRYQDILHFQSGRPRKRTLDLRFGAFLKNADIPARWTYPRFLRAMRIFPGWPVTLIWPDATVMHGIIEDHAFDEVSDCQTEIVMKFDVLREYPQGKVMAL